MRLIFNLYSTFNALFNIKFSIRHSTVHFMFNSSFTHSVIYSTISTVYSTFNFNIKKIQLFIQLSTLIQHSTIPLSSYFFEPLLLLFSDAYHCLLNMAAARTMMPTTEIKAYDDDTRLHFDVKSDLPRFQLTRFYKALTRFPRNCRAAYYCFRGTQRQFSENICSEDDLRSRIFGTFVVKFLACLPLLRFSNI